MDDRITDEPLAPEPWGDKPPWEEPGRFRLDTEPHRGGVLYGLGVAAEVAGLVSIFGGCTAPVATVLGLVVAVLARQDLNKMRRGIMDPPGAAKTEKALRLGITGVAPGTTFTAFWTLTWVSCMKQ